MAMPLRALVVAVSLASPASADSEWRLGLGVHYWQTLDDLADDGFDLDDSGYAELVSIQYSPSTLLKFELDLEYYDGGIGGSTSDAYSPIFFVIVGTGFVYGAVGVGVTTSSGLSDDISDPFYAGRVGVDLTLLPKLHLDLNLNYRTDVWADLEGVDTDTVTLGAIVRVAF